MAPSHGMGARQGHNFGIVESHAVKNVPQVSNGTRSRPLVGVGEAAVGRTGGSVAKVSAAKRKGDGWAATFFDGHHAGKRVQVGVGEVGEFALDGFQSVPGDLQTGVGAPTAFWLKSHASAVAASRLRECE